MILIASTYILKHRTLPNVVFKRLFVITMTLETFLQEQPRVELPDLARLLACLLHIYLAVRSNALCGRQNQTGTSVSLSGDVHTQGQSIMQLPSEILLSK